MAPAEAPGLSRRWIAHGLNLIGPPYVGERRRYEQEETPCTTRSSWVVATMV